MTEDERVEAVAREMYEAMRLEYGGCTWDALLASGQAHDNDEATYYIALARWHLVEVAKLAQAVRDLPLAGDTIVGVLQEWLRENAARAVEGAPPAPWTGAADQRALALAAAREDIRALAAALRMIAAVVGDASEDDGHCILCRRNLGQPHSKPCPVPAAGDALARPGVVAATEG